MRSPEERLARLLERHPELRTVGDDDLIGSAIIRRDQLLVPAAHAGRVEESVRDWTDRREDLDDLGAARIRLRRDADVPDLISTVLSPAGMDASPVHMFRGEPRYDGGPADTPVPMAPVPAPDGAHPGPVSVAVLDTGLSQHPWFPPQAWEALGHDEVADELDADNDYRLDAQAGHGTFVAGVIRQHAPRARLLVGRVLGSDGVCDEVDLLSALQFLAARSRAAGRRIDVLNLSLGAYTWDDRPPAQLAEVIAGLTEGSVVVAAAGNAGGDRVFWPAALPDVVGVGALSDDGTRATFSNRGDWVGCWAPGVGVASSFVTFDGPEPPRADIDPDCFRGYARWSGTSFAAPRIAAEVARRADEQGRPVREVLAEVLRDFPAPDDNGATGSR